MNPKQLLIVCVVAFCLPGAAKGKDWARDMFATTSHDFGVVARGAKVEYAFEFENLYEENVHIASVRSSCGCTSPSITKDWIATREKSAVVAAFNTLSFTGKKTAVITVVFDQPYYAELQLQVAGFIRTDIVFDPPKLDFGQIRKPGEIERKLLIKYAGRSDWTIKDVRSEFKHYKVTLGDPVRKGMNVAYQMTVRFKDDAPAGNLVEPLVLVTDDQTQKQVVVPVEGKILPALMVSPQSLNLGRVSAGEEADKRLVVRADQAFRITKISTTDDRIECEYSQDAKKLHFVNVRFQPDKPEQAKALLEKLTLQTDLQGGTSAEVIVTGSVE